MALQDVCGSLGMPVGPEWYTPATLSMSLDDTSLHFGGGHFELGGLHATKGGTPLQFYVPVPEYLSESPIQFGQSVPSNAPSRSSSFQGPSPSSLPSFSPLSPSPSVPLPFPMSHGTTTLAFVFQGGVIAAADTRSSCSGLIACPASAKILPVHAHMVGTTSGTSADCMLWKRILSRECRLYQLRNRRRLSVGGTAKLLSHMLHPFKGTELCVAATLCGWDGEGGGAEEEKLPSLQEVLPLPSKAQEEVGGEKRGQSTSKERGGAEDGSSGAKRGVAVSEDRKDVAMGTENSAAVGMPHGHSGPRLCYVCSDGTLLKGGLFSVGSGSPYAYSVLDGGLQWGLSLAEACSLAREAVYRATHRDAYSGNCVDLYHITARGWRRREREELREEYYREKERERWRVEERRREREKEREGQR